MAAVTAAVVGGAAVASQAYTGYKAGQAAEKASEMQAQAGNEGMKTQYNMYQQLREDLAPYTQIGQELIPQAQNLYSPTAYESVRNDPTLQAIQQDAERKVLASQAARGRLGTGETPEMLQDMFTRSSLGFLGQQRSDLLNAIRLGQASAAQQGAAGVQTGANVAETLSGIGNAQASGIVGKQNAYNQAIGNTVSLLGSFLK